MSIFSGGSGAVGVAAAGVVVVGVAAWVQFGDKDTLTVLTSATPPEQTAVPQDTVTAAPQAPTGPASDEGVQKTAEEAAPIQETPAQTPQPAQQAAAVAPTFDEVRQETDGTTIIAGQAAPGAEIKILQDGQEVATATADGAGKFAAIAFLTPDGQGHVLSLLQNAQGAETASVDQIILAPVLAPTSPVQVAAADIAPEPETPVAAAPAPAEETAVPQSPAIAPEAPVEVAQTAETTVTDETTAPQALAEAPAPADPVQETVTGTLTEETAPIQQTVAVETPPAPQPAEVAETAPVVAQIAETPTAETPTTEALATETLVSEAPATEAPATETQTASTQPDPQPPAAPETRQVAVLKATEQGVELLNTPRPEAMENVALDTISYSDAGDVQLAGRAQTDTRAVQVYLNNDAIISLPVDDAGRWRGDLPDVDEGIYTLRVDEVSDSGKITSRVETPFKRESPEVLAKAAAAEDGPLKQITVQKGATLWAIAQERYGSGLLYVNVFKANGATIRDPNLIYPGQIFDLPD